MHEDYSKKFDCNSLHWIIKTIDLQGLPSITISWQMHMLRIPEVFLTRIFISTLAIHKTMSWHSRSQFLVFSCDKIPYFVKVYYIRKDTKFWERNWSFSVFKTTTVWKTDLPATRVVGLPDNNSRLIFWFIIIFSFRLFTQQQISAFQ